MRLFSLEHGRWAYWADFGLYGLVVALLAAVTGLAGPREGGWQMAGAVAAGLASWTAVEYALHRFVLHGLQPFQRWHAEHHRRPTALICTPTILTAALFAALVFAPALWLAGPWVACALTLGVLTGYLVYATTHHATHHWRGGGAWLKQRKRWHARHHHGGEAAGCYGVTTGFWDHVFGSAQTAPTGLQG
jgi:cyclopropane-fatty-acyl-phospholipid synthase